MKSPCELKRIQELFKKLLAVDSIKFPKPRKRMLATRKPGVYLIINSKSKVVHVGRTVRGKNGIAQRLKNHLNGKSSFVGSFLKRDGSKLRGRYSFKCLAVKNSRKRALLEAYATGHLCPKHLGLGEKSVAKNSKFGRTTR